MHDEAPTPPTLSDLAHDVSGIVCWCNRCHHCGVLPIGELRSRLGPMLPFPHVHGRLRCQACGSTDVHARPDWPKLGQVTRHHAAFYGPRSRRARIRLIRERPSR